MQSIALSFTEVARELRAPLLRFLTRYAGDRQLAEDLLQETLIRIDRGLATFERRSELQTWAFSIATRVAADHFREPANRVAIVEMDEVPDPADPERSVDERIVIDEMNACVRKVIDSLPADYRAALILHDIEGLSAEATASIIGCTLATAKIRMHRARARLADALRRECEFYRDDEAVFRCDRKPQRSGSRRD